MQTSKNKKTEFFIALAFVLLGAALRLIPHAPNFVPIGALALFAGTYFSRKTALFLPLAAMAVSDIFLGFYDPKIMAAVYVCFIFSVLLGFWLKKRKKWQTILGAAVLSSVVFFLATNFAVWIFTSWYEKTFFGLLQCYIMALPFFKNTLFGDLFYASVFFSAFEFSKALAGKFLLRRSADSISKIGTI